MAKNCSKFSTKTARGSGIRRNISKTLLTLVSLPVSGDGPLKCIKFNRAEHRVNSCNTYKSLFWKSNSKSIILSSDFSCKTFNIGRNKEVTVLLSIVFDLLLAMENNNIIQQFVVHKSQDERMKDDAIFLSQNVHTKLFNIQSFQTNLLGSNAGIKDDSAFNVSKQLLQNRECENSPFYFKVSGCVSYCQQLQGCCIFYNTGITKDQMNILYSLQCQQEVYEEACKLYKNTIPNYEHLLEFAFVSKLRHHFNMLGLSEDTLILRVKNATPSQRISEQFIQNSAQLQIQLMRVDFVISPNLTQVFMKTYLSKTPSLCLENTTETPSTATPPPPLTVLQENIPLTSNDAAQETRQQFEYVDGDNFLDINEESESDDESSDSSEEVIFNKSIKVQNINTPKKKIDKGVENVVVYHRPPNNRKQSSLISEDTASSRDYIIDKSNASSASCVDIIRPSHSTTGVTERFSKLYAPSIGNQSHTGITEILSDLNIPPNNEMSSHRGAIPKTFNRAPSSSGVTNVMHEMNIEDTDQIYGFASDVIEKFPQYMEYNILTDVYLKDHDGNLIEIDEKSIYDYRYLQTLVEMDKAFVHQIYKDDFIYLDQEVDKYINYFGFIPNNSDIQKAFNEVRSDQTSRLKQAVYVKLLLQSDLLKE